MDQAHYLHILHPKSTYSIGQKLNVGAQTHKVAKRKIKVGTSQLQKYKNNLFMYFPVVQMVEHGASNAKIMGSIPRESKSWSNVKL